MGPVTGVKLITAARAYSPILPLNLSLSPSSPESNKVCRYQQHKGACVIVPHIHSRREREGALQSYSFYKKQPIRSFLRHKRWESLSTYNQRKLKMRVFHYLGKLLIQRRGNDTIQISFAPPVTSQQGNSNQESDGLYPLATTRPLFCVFAYHRHRQCCIQRLPRHLWTTHKGTTRLHASQTHSCTYIPPLLVGIVYIHHRTLTVIHTSGLNPPLPLSLLLSLTTLSRMS